MKENAPERYPFEGLPEEQVQERLAAYEKTKQDAAEARKEFRIGIVDVPQPGKAYIRFELPEGQLARGFSFGDDERGGDVLEVRNGALIELGKKGLPVNPVLRQRVESGELDVSVFPRVETLETQAEGEKKEGPAEAAA